jgi:hypothetical protein
MSLQIANHRNKIIHFNLIFIKDCTHQKELTYQPSIIKYLIKLVRISLIGQRKINFLQIFIGIKIILIYQTLFNLFLLFFTKY